MAQRSMSARSSRLINPRKALRTSIKSHFWKISSILAINAHKMAPRKSKRLQKRAWEDPTKGLLWFTHLTFDSLGPPQGEARRIDGSASPGLTDCPQVDKLHKSTRWVWPTLANGHMYFTSEAELRVGATLLFFFFITLEPRVE